MAPSVPPNAFEKTPSAAAQEADGDTATTTIKVKDNAHPAHLAASTADTTDRTNRLSPPSCPKLDAGNAPSETKSLGPASPTPDGSENGSHSASSGASPDPSIEGQLAALLASLYGLYHTEIDLSLDRTYRFLERLGNPHLRLPKVVHVAGTNGKGSTIAILRALLEASGHAVHAYTSPHLVHPTERIRLAGTPITSEALLNLLTECIEINDGEPITFFELFTCAALLAFARTPADYLLLETGMGGRLDTTNVVPNPVATIITAISHDHTSFLGDSLPEIAREKAGIMKKGAPCIVGYQFPEAVEAGVFDVFRQQSTSLSPEAPLLIHGAQWCSAPESGRMLFRYEDDSILTRMPSLSGTHQLWNAGAAMAAFRVIAPGHFRPEILSTAMEKIDWPGRLQTLENHAFCGLVPDGWEIVIDGGHNDSGGLVLAKQMEAWRRQDAKPIHLILAMVDRKDPLAFLNPLRPYIASLGVTAIENEPSSYPAEKLAEIIRQGGFTVDYVAATPETALKSLAAHGSFPGAGDIGRNASLSGGKALTASARSAERGGAEARLISAQRSGSSSPVNSPLDENPLDGSVTPPAPAISSAKALTAMAMDGEQGVISTHHAGPARVVMAGSLYLIGNILAKARP